MPNYNMSIKQILKRKAVDMKSCAIIGHRKFQITKELECNLNETLNQLIVDKGVETFLFGSRSQFTDLCYKIVSQLKKENLSIRRVYVRAEYPIISEEYLSYLLTLYEDTYYFDKRLVTGKLNYIKRNEIMIDKAYFCLFYYDENYLPQRKTVSGTNLAYRYASKKGKQIINIFE